MTSPATLLTICQGGLHAWREPRHRLCDDGTHALPPCLQGMPLGQHLALTQTRPAWRWEVATTAVHLVWIANPQSCGTCRRVFIGLMQFKKNYAAQVPGSRLR